MEDVFARRLTGRLRDLDIARRLVAAGLDVPAKIRAASEGALRKALKGKGINARVAAVRRAYPPRR